MGVLQNVVVLLAAGILTMFFTQTPKEYNVPILNSSYDYIIIGSGSAGSVLAARLSEDPNVTVLLLEAGSIQDNNPMISTPAMAALLQHTELDWEYYTVPQKTSHFGSFEQKSYWPRGRVVGGSSILNYLMYLRGSRYDYDGWAANGCDGWSFNEVIPYFMKSEDILVPELTDSDYHGNGGPLEVTESKVTPIIDIFLQAGKELGEDVLDCNGKQQEGFCPIQSTRTKNGIRASTYEAFLKPALTRKNLHLSSQSVATKIIIEEKAAKGVEFIHKGRKIRTKAEKEVILSAGAVETPHLLMLSGIGPKNHLQEKGIPVIADLPVGENVQEHLMVLMYNCINGTQALSMEDALSFENKIKYVLFGKGSLTLSAALEGTAFLHTDLTKGKSYPDIQLGLLSVTLEKEIISSFSFFDQIRDEYINMCPGRGFVIAVMLLHEESRGIIRLQSKDPFDSPLIDPKYLEHPEDIKTLIQGIRYYQKLMDTNAFQNIVTSKQKPISACSVHQTDSDDYWECFIRHTAITQYHATSSAAMGPIDHAQTVVDPQLRVKGVRGLRVVDASIMPKITSGNTNAPIIMIAEKAADMILGKNPLPRREL